MFSAPTESSVERQCKTYCNKLMKGVSNLDQKALSHAVHVIVEAIRAERRLFVIGNGGNPLS